MSIGGATRATLGDAARAPRKRRDTLPKAVALARNTLGFDSLADAKPGSRPCGPFLRAEFLFQPQTVGRVELRPPSRGDALKLVGTRVFNRCTGEVSPRSRPRRHGRPPGAGHEDAACTQAAHRGAQAAATPPTPPELPEELTKTPIAEVMTKIRLKIFACYEQFHSRPARRSSLRRREERHGPPIPVGPAFDGTPTGLCVLQPAKNARFPRFKLDEQQFTYPFFLRQ